MYGQDLLWKNANYHQQEIQVRDTVNVNLQAVLPDKFVVKDAFFNVIPASLYTIDFLRNELIFDPSLRGQSLTLTYYTNPLLVRSVYAQKDSALIVSNPDEVDIFHQIDPLTRKKKTELFEGLNSQGSMVRGIRFGNNQSASVQSSLNLELSGKLSDDISITAAISDNNVPIETDGFTQKLQEFDKVYIELANKNSKIRAGHIDLSNKTNFFTQFDQKVTGLQVATRIENEDSSLDIFATGSVTRGEFASSELLGQDGNQGPYRLTGKHQEMYIIVLSGSERVFIDGILLERGETNDYVINYNTGEITFTTKRLITSNTRIYVEYLYNSRNYSQLFLFGGVNYEREKWSLNGSFYSQSDAKNNALGDELTDEEKQILALAGNDRSKMYTVSAKETDYDANKILYKKITDAGLTYFGYSTDSDEVLYQVGFTYVGAGQGNYRQVNTNENGKIFEFVPPIGDGLQGDYEPIKQLIAPEKLQIYSLAGKYRLPKDGVVAFDMALSQYDKNTFSSIDNDENTGLAARVYGNQTFNWRKWLIKPTFEVDFIQRNFKAPQRIRDVEFARDFNLEQTLEPADQTLIMAGFEAVWNEKLSTNYGATYLENKAFYKGLKHEIGTVWKTDKEIVEAKVNTLSTDGKYSKSTFTRYFADAKRNLSKKIWVGARFWGENNDVMEQETKLRSPISFKWSEAQLKAGFTDSLGIKMDVTLYTRKDDSIRLGNWEHMQQSQGLILNSDLIKKTNHQLGVNFHYRKVDYTYLDAPKEDFLTGSIRWYKALFNQGVQLNATYEIGSGVEPQREFQYVKVADGMGIYKWTDYNGDGIEQLDEFEQAEFIDQANYIRVYTNTVTYMKTNKNAVNFSVRIQPKQFFKTSKPFIERWTFSQSVAATNSLRKDGQALEWNPFVKSENALGKTRNIRTSIFFNQGGKYKWSSNYIYNEQETQSYVYTGTESRDSKSHLLQVRYRITNDFLAHMEGEYVTIISGSAMFASRRYELNNYKLSPKVSYQSDKTLISLVYIHQHKENVVGIEELTQMNLGTEIQWNDSAKMNLLGSFNYVKNKFEGNQESVVGNQMMEGLRAGNNMVWQLQLQRQISSFLNLSISYDGRKTEDNKAIHTGSVQLQARF